MPMTQFNYDLTEQYDMVHEFHRKFNCAIEADYTGELYNLRKNVVEEEWAEFIDALDKVQHNPSEGCEEALLKEICDVVYVGLGTYITFGIGNVWLRDMVFYEPDDLPHLPVAEVDSPVSFVNEIEEMMGWALAVSMHFRMDFEGAFKAVHNSNMSKLWEDGKPKYRADGKVLKPNWYTPPKLKDFV
jgi:predicted HAD superfamily Cof-like phosphohydrolase